MGFPGTAQYLHFCPCHIFNLLHRILEDQSRADQGWMICHKLTHTLIIGMFELAGYIYLVYACPAGSGNLIMRSAGTSVKDQGNRCCGCQLLQKLKL